MIDFREIELLESKHFKGGDFFMDGFSLSCPKIFSLNGAAERKIALGINLLYQCPDETCRLVVAVYVSDDALKTKCKSHCQELNFVGYSTIIGSVSGFKCEKCNTVFNCSIASLEDQNLRVMKYLVIQEKQSIEDAIIRWCSGLKREYREIFDYVKKDFVKEEFREKLSEARIKECVVYCFKRFHTSPPFLDFLSHARHIVYFKGRLKLLLSKYKV